MNDRLHLETRNFFTFISRFFFVSSYLHFFWSGCLVYSLAWNQTPFVFHKSKSKLRQRYHWLICVLCWFCIFTVKINSGSSLFLVSLSVILTELMMYSGLLHITNITRGRLTAVSDLLMVDEKVKVLVVKSNFPDKISLR